MATTLQPTFAGSTTDRVADTSRTVERRRRRALWIIGILALVSIGSAVDLILLGHTDGERIWGPITAVLAFVTGALSFTYVFHRSRNRAARLVLYGLWFVVGFFGYGGTQSHRIYNSAVAVSPASTPAPALAPLMFTGFGIASAFQLRTSSKEV